MSEAELTVANDRIAIFREARQATPRTRDPEHVIQSVMATVMADMSVAVGAIYALPRAGEIIRGPSIRLAEIVRHFWGGIWIEAVTVQEYPQEVYAKVVGLDAVTGNVTAEIAVERIVDRYGRRYSIDGVVNAKRAALAKAKRNVILDLIPASLVSSRLVVRLRAALAARQNEIKAAYRTALTSLSQAFGVAENRLAELLAQRLGMQVDAPDGTGPSTDWMLTVIEYSTAIEDRMALPSPTIAAPQASAEAAVESTEDAAGSDSATSGPDESSDIVQHVKPMNLRRRKG